MAIGVRILSNNFSGQTADVTFYPTSGGTLNLGLQTIPFNNLTTDPYGVYNLNFSGLGYTYELTVNQAVDGKESFVFVSKMIPNNYYGYAALNFTDITAQVLQVDVDYTGWYIDNIYPLTNSGYMLYFQNDNTCDLNWVVFLDSEGNQIDEFQTNSNCDYDYNDVGGKVVSFLDNRNGFIKYFDGKNVYTKTWDTNYQYMNQNTGWDGVTSDGSIMLVLQNTTANTQTNYSVLGDTMTQFGDTFDYNLSGQTLWSYFDGTFITQLVYNNSYQFQSLNLYDTSGNTLQNIDLTVSGGNYYDNYQLSYYGDNKMFMALWRNGDVDLEYKIIQYDGNLNQVRTTTHVRGTNYQSLWNTSNPNLYPNDGGTDAFSIIIGNYTGGNNVGNTFNYVDMIYMLSGDTSISTYVYATGTTKTINTQLLVSDTISTSVADESNNVGILTLSSGGNGNITNINYSVSEISSHNGYRVGNGSVHQFFQNSGINYSLYHINETNTLADSVTGITSPSNYYYTTEHFGKLFIAYNYSGVTHYLDETSENFQNTGIITGTTNNFRNPEYYFKDDYKNNGPIIVYDYNSYESHILSSTGFTSSYLPAANGSRDLSIGKDRFLWVYCDAVTNFTTINLYDFNYNLINTLTTDHTSFWNVDACKDRYVVIINENSLYYIYEVTDSEINLVQITDQNSYYTMNDYVWWD